MLTKSGSGPTGFAPSLGSGADEQPASSPAGRARRRGSLPRRSLVPAPLGCAAPICSYSHAPPPYTTVGENHRSLLVADAAAAVALRAPAWRGRVGCCGGAQRRRPSAPRSGPSGLTVCGRQGAAAHKSEEARQPAGGRAAPLRLMVAPGWRRRKGAAAGGGDKKNERINVLRRGEEDQVVFFLCCVIVRPFLRTRVQFRPPGC